MNIKIYTMTHKKFDVPEDSLYQPLHVGRSTASDLGYQGDDTGDNISDLNCYYSELTGWYWIWKNVSDLDYVGVCHYRRYLTNNRNLVFQKDELLSLLERYDILTSKCIELNDSYHYGFSQNHNIDHLDETGRVIKEMFPEYYDTYDRLVHSNHTYFGNIAIMSKQRFDQYSEWLFSIFSEVEKRADLTAADQYHQRVFGFISEFLLYVWVTYNKLSACECKVALIGEKVETKEVKCNLEEFMKKGDLVGAKSYFMQFHKNRPDILMEASDVSGDLRIYMQIIATADAERKHYGSGILDRITDIYFLTNQFKMLNGIVIRYSRDRKADNDPELLQTLSLTREAIEISCMAFCTDEKNTQKTILSLCQDAQIN